jgi:prepilin-type N-terminal cleavage/methylation domain-containing protein
MSGDSGFGMVELLVALAICAALAMGAGSLISLGLKLRDRVELTEGAQQALLDLRALTSVMAGGTWVGLGDVGDGRFQLCSARPGQQATLLGTFSAEPGVAGYKAAHSTSAADIGVFQSVRLEYLTVTPAKQTWQTADVLAGSRPVAVRLRLGLGARTWRMLLWMERRSPVAVLAGELHCAA